MKYYLSVIFISLLLFNVQCEDYQQKSRPEDQVTFVVVFILIVCWCACCWNCWQKLYNKQNNFVTGITTIIAQQQNSIAQVNHIPMNLIPTREDILNINLPYSYTQSTNAESLREHGRRTDIDTIVVMYLEQQPSTPPPAYDELSLYDSMAIEQQCLSLSTYANFIQSTNEAESTI
ncbi:unnamed protein product [Adineta steineri]|uniref:Uncharacterized protein n=1 Tax=Adineta steineri TaxID=433720 RepID=A0A820BDD6_9BILA|nr:unnamed protein product [Adineta steineri]CAF1023574.1 unnamed protein product [Adineta steineri]CAF1095927.1 unnamed protein product [Adineta steineri]CAF3980766.1 unnamed protein product [Adineta steineri]CAF4177693.1 unnamed protein product [Adineta steineri]